MWYKDSVKVERYTSSATSDTGESVRNLSTVISELKCDLFVNKSKLAVAQPGTTPIKYMKMTCKISDIKEGDIITDLSDSQQYEVTSVGKCKLLPHLEIELEGGVV